MANPEVDRLIAELSGILEQNRQKRNAADAMMLGMQQGFQQAQARASQGAAAAGQAAGKGAYAAGKNAGAPGSSETGYGGDPVSPYRISKDSMGQSRDNKVPASGGSREGRLGLASKYIEANGGPPQRESQLLSKNPYTGSGYEFLPENDTPPGAPDPALEEQKKRFTQNLMLSRGQTGGPMGGAGQPPTSDGLDPAVVNAVSQPTRGDYTTMEYRPKPGVSSLSVAQPMPVASPPQGWSQQDYDLLTALSQRYPGG